MRKVAIYGIGANFGGIDVSKNFLHSGVAGVGWDQADAPDLHNYIDSIEKGDIIYIKMCIRDRYWVIATVSAPTNSVGAPTDE